MKHYSIFLFAAFFGLAQIAQAAAPDEGKKGKQKAQQSVHKAPQAVHQVQKHAGQPPAAFKKSSNVPHQVARTPAYHPVNTNQVNTNQVNKKVHENQRTLARQNNANVQLQKKANSHNAAVAAQNAQRMNQQQKSATIAAQNAAQLRNQQQQNNAMIAARNGQRSNRQSVSQGNWNGLSFAEASRRHRHECHDRNWWRGRYGNNIILFGGGYYYPDAGYWYPAYGYDPAYSTYEYDGPIYGYNDLPPGEVVTNVQGALQQQGYYDGEIDGSIGPMTRAALRRYQRDHGLETTAAIDQPTLASLGLG